MNTSHGFNYSSCYHGSYYGSSTLFSSRDCTILYWLLVHLWQLVYYFTVCAQGYKLDGNGICYGPYMPISLYQFKMADQRPAGHINTVQVIKYNMSLSVVKAGILL